MGRTFIIIKLNINQIYLRITFDIPRQVGRYAYNVFNLMIDQVEETE